MMFSRDFLNKTIPLGWSDLLWGYKNKLIGWRVPVDIALDRLETDFVQGSEEVQLAGLTKDDDWQVARILQDLSEAHPVPETESKRKWLYLTLLWLYENLEGTEDPLGKIEEIYADFGYPDEIRSFVRFVPSDDSYDPRAYTSEENLSRLLRKWRDYLDRTRASFMKESDQSQFS